MAKLMLAFFFLVFSGFAFSDVGLINDKPTKEKGLSEFETMLSDFDTCDIRDVYFDEINKVASNKYFLTKNLNPARIEQDYVIYDINESFHGIPVKKIIIPNQYPIHALFFDASLKRASSVLSIKLKNGFHSLGDEHYYDKPVLMVDPEDKSKSVLTCGSKN